MITEATVTLYDAENSPLLTCDLWINDRCLGDVEDTLGVALVNWINAKDRDKLESAAWATLHARGKDYDFLPPAFHRDVQPWICAALGLTWTPTGT